MTNTQTFPVASPAQLAFINQLVSTHEVPAALLNLVNDGQHTMKDASAMIEALKMTPWKRPAARAAAPSLTDTLPLSCYAIPLLEVPSEIGGTQELLFVQMREYRGRRSLVRLVGAPGGFSRYRISTTNVELLAAVLLKEPLRYTQLFAQHYSVCGCCRAELTDEVSRDLGLGPVCRKRFGL